MPRFRVDPYSKVLDKIKYLGLDCDALHVRLNILNSKLSGFRVDLVSLTQAFESHIAAEYASKKKNLK